MRITNAGVGGAFGGREDLSMQIHACMLALHTGRPVKMVYSREESFFGHVHRHPARLRYEHGATLDGRLVYVKARIVLDGGAYASSSMAVCLNAASTGVGPYECPNADIDSYVVYTNNPPCGAMRGFGAVQTCFAYEAQMDKLAVAAGIDPVELRRRNAMATGTSLPTGQAIDGPAPVDQLLEELGVDAPPLARRTAARSTFARCREASRTPRTARGSGAESATRSASRTWASPAASTITRPRAFACRSRAASPRSRSTRPACEVGQGSVTVQAQIARDVLGVERVIVLAADTEVGNAGSSSASRQTWFTGGAVRDACEAVRDALLERARERFGPAADATALDSLAELIGDDPLEATREYRPRRTFPLDENGQGDAHLAFSFAAHRAVVDVDVELGLVRVVEIATAQDVGRAINPIAVEGQIEGGIAQGLGLALMEEIQLPDGRLRNASFTDYLIPTILDMPPVRSRILELAQPHSPYGLNGIAEAPTIASTAAIVGAMRAATGRALPRVPVRPDDIVGLAERAAETA